MITIQIERGDTIAFRVPLRTLFELLNVTKRFQFDRPYRIVLYNCDGEKIAVEQVTQDDEE